MSSQGEEAGPAGRLSEMQSARAGDTTLQNLVGLLHEKLALSARLPVLAYEAEVEGHRACASTFQAVGDLERDQVAALVAALRDLLAETPGGNPT